MKKIFRKITAIAASALMMGTTMGVAAAASYPNPFVVSGAANVAVVYGTGSGVSSLDLVQAGNIQTNLQSFMTGSTGTTGSVSGEGAALFTGGTKIYVNDSLNTVKTVLTKSDLPTVLADQSFSGNVDASMTQKIDIGTNPKVSFTKQPTSSDDPSYALAISTAQANYIYNATATFSKAVNFSHADSEGETINLFGMSFTVSSTTDTDTLVLLKSAEKASLSTESPTADVTIGGKTYVIELVSASDTAATIQVTDDTGTSESREVDEAASKKINGITVAVITADETNLKLTATVVAGSEKVTLEDGSSVAVGEDDTAVDGTLVDFGTGNPNNLTVITISVYAPESDKDAVKAGEAFIDPIYGTFKLDFSGFNIATDSTAREAISITPNSDDKMDVKFTDSRGYEQSFTWARDVAGVKTAGGRDEGKLMIDDEGRNMTVFERAFVRKSEYVVVGNEDDGRLLKLTQVKNATADAGTGFTSSQVEFTDVFSGDVYKATFTSDGVGTIPSIGGKSYDVRYWGARGLSDVSYNVSVDYPDSNGNAVGIVYPTIETSKGAKVAFYEPLGINLTSWDGRSFTERPAYNLTTIRTPDGDGYTDIYTLRSTNDTYNGNFSITPAGGNIMNVSTTDVANSNGTIAASGGLQFNLTQGWLGTNANGSVSLYLMELDGTGNINQSALIVWEEKDDNTGYEAAIIQLENGRTGDDGLGIDTTASGLTWHNNSANWDSTRYSNSKIRDKADLWGTILTLDSGDSDQPTASISYPDEQLYAQFYIAAESAVITAGATTSASQLGDVLVKDSEVASVQTKNLIVVGGSCINSVAANVLGVAYPTCGSAWTTATGVGAGQFLIKSFADKYTTGKIALLVAGYEAADTAAAATALKTKSIDTSKSYTGSTSTVTVTEVTAA